MESGKIEKTYEKNIERYECMGCNNTQSIIWYMEYWEGKHRGCAPDICCMKCTEGPYAYPRMKIKSSGDIDSGIVKEDWD